MSIQTEIDIAFEEVALKIKSVEGSSLKIKSGLVTLNYNANGDVISINKPGGEVVTFTKTAGVLTQVQSVSPTRTITKTLTEVGGRLSTVSTVIS